MPAKQAPRCMAPAPPVFAGAPAPTSAASTLSTALSHWNGVCQQRRGMINRRSDIGTARLSSVHLRRGRPTDVRE
ncbi:hypothetical protein EFK07_24605 [Pseudomonas putida]|uniref:Uncharacterized protein n=1 Tax=Pseudomonas putida TaxID=303 RepID=A0A3M8SU90_PSEPU|nr:hypothetical protein EFK07_24605 [Pseudomonas putida]